MKRKLFFLFVLISMIGTKGLALDQKDGVYQIGSGEDLVAFAELVNSGDGTANAVLTADIDMSASSAAFQPIGKESAMYSGTFDGQGHKISNLNVTFDFGRVGIFGVIQSPATIKNLVMDETCSIEQTKEHRAALIGSVMGTKGDVYLENLGMEGTIRLVGGNGAGILGNNDGDVANLHLKNCYVTGNILGSTRTSSGLLIGIAGTGSIIENCWGTGRVEGNHGDDSYFVNGFKSGSIINCYCKYGNQVPNITDEQVASGELCYLLNSESFINPTWFQTLDEDPHPVWDSTHGTVYKAGEKFGDVHDDASFAIFKDAYLSAEKKYCETVIAEQALIDRYAECIQATKSCSTMEEFADICGMKAIVESSANAYAALQAKADEVTVYLEEHDDFKGEKRNQLEFYLAKRGEPSELYPNGTIPYIMETHTMTEDEVADEMVKIDQMLKEAIADGVLSHSDITNLLTNADFSDAYNGWEGKTGTATNSPVAECKNQTCDFYQTLSGLKNGVYELQANAFFRPGNPNSNAGNLTSTNYGAMLYANGIQNYVMAAIEDMISVDDAVDGENCFITAGASGTDYAVYNNDEYLMGYVPSGQTGFKYAVNGGRYLNRVLVNVTDGQLAIGFKMPGTGIANDCMDIANVKLFYDGTLEEASEQLDATLQGMAARAQTLYNYEASNGMDYAQYPNYSAELRAELKTAIDAVAATSDVEGKYALVGTFSDLFQQVYDNKKVYIELMDFSETLMTLLYGFTSMLSDEQVEEMNNAIAEIYEAYQEGTATNETIDAITNRLTFLHDFLPKKVDGIYQIANGEHLSMFGYMVNDGDISAKAVLTADIDLNGIDWTPIGTGPCYNTVNGPAKVTDVGFAGMFDGQGHTVSNFNIVQRTGGEAVGLFGVLTGTVKNLGVIGATFNATTDCRAGAIAGTVTASNSNAGLVENCYVINSSIRADDRVCGGIAGAVCGGEVKNCYAANNDLKGYGDRFGGIAGDTRNDSGWTGTVTDCYTDFRRVTSSQAGTTTGGEDNVSTERFKSGEIAYKLNRGATEGNEVVWYQTILEDDTPVLDNTHFVVRMTKDGQYTNFDDVNANLLALINEAQSLAATTKIGDKAPLITSDEQLTDNCLWQGGYEIQNIIDGKFDTYFHSRVDTPLENGTEYFQVSLQVLVTGFYIEYTGRSDGQDSGNEWHDTPDRIRIEATNTPNDPSSWTVITTEEYDIPDIHGAHYKSEEPIVLGAPYQYIRFYILHSTSGHDYWNIAEFQMYNAAGEAGSPYENNAELAKVVDAIEATCEAKIALVRAGTGTQADIDELQALIDSLKKLTDVEYLNPTLSQSDRTIYDLTGRRVEKAKKGLYIINGKKVLVK